MAKRLTEEMVIARTKISDLSKIKRLNCWGSELVDVSLLRRMPSVEVLSLSINKINSLEDFGLCKRLEELYIRQNDIRDLNQIMHLQNLPNLKNLWLGENPCASNDGYRNAVLRALPQLQKLDNIAVSPEELKEAQRKGKVLTHPDDPQESEEEVYVPNNQYRYQDYQQEPEYSPQRSPSRQEMSPPRRQQEQQQQQRRSYSPEQDHNDRRRSSHEQSSPKQVAQQYYDDYANGDRFANAPTTFRPSEGSEVSYRQDGPVRSASQHNCSVAHRPPFARRPVTRNSNILSAVLCLVKELDYPSLEVVEMAVRCRMDELDE